MKVALLGDLHFGARGGSLIFDNYFKKFYSEFFFPYLKKHKIKHFIDLGDTFDVRKSTDTQILHTCMDYFFEPVGALEESHIIVGNHDVYFRNTNIPNTPELLLQDYPSIHVHSQIKDIVLDGRQITLCPWINKDNYQDVMQHLELTDSEIVIGHLEFAGFAMYKGSKNTHGMDPKIFKKFKRVLSGHFHTRSTDGNISYIGAPYEMNWQDCNDPRGFAVLDTDTLEVEYIDNPFKMFVKLYYDENRLPDISDVEGKEVKLYVTTRTDQKKFDKFVQTINNSNVVKLSIVEDFSEYHKDNEDDSPQMADTLSLIESYIDELDTDDNKEKIKGFMKAIYLETLDENNQE
jgi:hypothetical protein